MNLVNPIFLYLLIAIPVLLGLFVLARYARRRKIARFGHLSVLSALMPEASKYMPWVKITTQLVALAMIILAIVRPQYGEKEEKEFTPNGIEVMIAVDLSRSMLASSTSDINSVNRLERAKMMLDRLIDRLSGDKVGLVAFAGDAHLKMSMTTDFWMLRDYINDLNPNDIPYQGTDIGTAINLCVNDFTPNDPDHKKAIILLTDAEDLEGEAINIAQNAADNGVQINVVGFGSDPGSQIPVNAERSEFLRDPETGEIVTTVLNQELATQLAEIGNGVYVDGTASNAVDKLTQSLNSLGKNEFEKVTYKASAEQFPLLAFIAMILMVIDLFVLDTKIGWLKKINFFTRTK